MIQLPLISSAQTSTDSVKVSVTELRKVNQVIELYDGCQAQNELLNKQVDDCSQYQAQTHTTISHVQTLLDAKQQQITDADSIIKLQRQQVAGLTKTLKDTKKIAFRETIGYTIGGFAFGVALPCVIYFIKH